VTHPLRAAFQDQARACAGLGSPFMARLCTLLADRLDPGGPLGARLFGWPGDLGPMAASVPLRLCGALHALTLQGHGGLAAVYPPADADDAALWDAVAGALDAETAFIDRFLDSAPQTNEVRRSAALIATGHWLAARFNLPMVLSELGASAGLNTIWDRYALALPGRTFGPADPVLTLTPDWTGAPPPARPPVVTDRAAVDLNPIALDDADQRLRLIAYLWADQPHRRALTLAAIAARPPRPVAGDAVDWLKGRLAAPRPGHLHLIFHTIAWQYFPAPAQTRGRALIEAAGARTTPDTPLAWLAYEGDGATPGAALTLRLWPGDLTLALGRADFHGRWVDWCAPLAHQS
jgi:hypothetical protein